MRIKKLFKRHGNSFCSRTRNNPSHLLLFNVLSRNLLPRCIPRWFASPTRSLIIARWLASIRSWSLLCLTAVSRLIITFLRQLRESHVNLPYSILTSPLGPLPAHPVPLLLLAAVPALRCVLLVPVAGIRVTQRSSIYHADTHPLAY